MGGGNNVVNITGWNVNNGTNGTISTSSSSPIFNDAVNHGTKVAGIIGAVRNNGIGVAGIAGGDGFSSPGVHLHSMKITTNATGMLASLDKIGAAIVYGASSSGFGQQIMNHSWYADRNPYYRRYKDYGLLMDAIRQAYNTGVISVAGAGNGPAIPNTLTYPANAKDNWVITVGGSGVDGTGNAEAWNEVSTLGRSSENGQ